MYLDLMSDILQMPEIPYDLYDSPQEILIIIPLGWVKKDSLRLNIQDYRLFIEWERTFPSLKENLVPVKEDCYWWGISLAIDLPSQVYFDQIHSKLTPENILQIIIPKANIPDSIPLEIQE